MLNVAAFVRPTTTVDALDEPNTITGKHTITIAFDGLTIHLSGWQGDEAVMQSIDKLLEPLNALRAKASARLVDAIVSDLEAHPLTEIERWKERHMDYTPEELVAIRKQQPHG